MKKYITINPRYAHSNISILARATVEQGIPDASVVVYRGRNVLAKLENAGLMIKSYKRPRLAKGLVYHWLRKPKCRRAFSNGMRLREMGIRTPEPFFAVEIYNRYGALANSFYACELLKGWKEMRGVQNNPDFDAIARAFAAFIFSMHIKGVFMSDLTPGNVLFRTGEDGYEFALVDINRMTFDCNSWKELSKNFRALLDTEDATATVATYYAAILKKNDIELPAADFESYARKIYSAHQRKLISRRRFKNMFSRKKK